MGDLCGLGWIRLKEAASCVILVIQVPGTFVAQAPSLPVWFGGWLKLMASGGANFCCGLDCCGGGCQNSGGRSSRGGWFRVGGSGSLWIFV